MFTPLRAVARDPEGKVLVVSAFSLIAVGTVAYHFLEGWSLINSLYFSVVTLATVGFGDLTPTTDIAKLFTVGYIMAGVGIIAAFASELSKVRAAERMAHRNQTSEAHQEP
jgi:voltage-gated potassium channel